MASSFKEKFKLHLAEFQTAPFLFVGSGLSRRYLNLENWEGLLRKYSLKTDKEFEFYRSSSNGNFPQLASKLCIDFFDKWWNEPEYKTNVDKFKTICTDKQSPLKIEISNYLSNIREQLTQNKQLLHEIDLLRDSVVDGIITTNWDRFLENIFKDFEVYIGQENLIFSPTQGVGEIYKIHGCCSEPNSLILTEQDYQNFEQRNAYLAAKLITIFTEHPIIFIGYSLQDDNINKLIKSIVTCLSNDNLSKIQNRLIFINFNPKVSGEPILAPSHKTYERYHIPITTIETNSFIEIFEVLKGQKRKIPAKILRKLKKQVYEFVVSSEAREKLFVMDIDEADEFDNLEVVYGVGVKSRLNDSGYTGFGADDLFEDIVFNNRNFEPDKILQNTIPKLIRQSSKKTNAIPIFKYLQQNNFITDNGDLAFKHPIKRRDENGNEIEEEIIPEKVVKLFEDIKKNGMEYYYPPDAYVKGLSKIKSDERKSILKYVEKEGDYNFMKHFTVFSETPIEEIRQYLCNNYDKLLHSEKTFESSQFKKMICWYDYITNYLSKINP